MKHCFWALSSPKTPPGAVSRQEARQNTPKGSFRPRKHRKQLFLPPKCQSFAEGDEEDPPNALSTVPVSARCDAIRAKIDQKCRQRCSKWYSFAPKAHQQTFSRVLATLIVNITRDFAKNEQNCPRFLARGWAVCVVSLPWSTFCRSLMVWLPKNVQALAHNREGVASGEDSVLWERCSLGREVF